jgi:hypothetical protein
MSGIHSDHDPMAGATPEEIMAALFANMVIQQTNMAMMLLGKVAHPETGEIIQDLEAAKMFIDQLAMLEVKTKGNLSKDEDRLLKQALSSLRMAFVEAVAAEGAAGGPAEPQHEAKAMREEAEVPAPTPGPPAEAKAGDATSTPPPGADESRKRFSKKY